MGGMVSTYFIGDIQGCFASLQKLLQKVEFDPRCDRVFLVGDLVNRGPDSLSVLRWVRENEDCVTTVLGNHDLHLIGAFLGIRKIRNKDTFHDVLAAQDKSDLIQWLRSRPLVYSEPDFLLVHGGLLPQWDLFEIADLADQAQQILRSSQALELFQAMSESGEGVDPKMLKLGSFLKTLTRIRICDAEGRVDFEFTDEPQYCPAPYRPWFEWSHRRSSDKTIYFGHWSALGFYRGNSVVALDTGCVWGRYLSAFRLEDQTLVQVAAVE